MKMDVLHSRSFMTYKDTFFEQRAKTKHLLSDQKEQFLSNWCTMAKEKQQFLDRVPQLLTTVSQKTSHDGLLWVGYEISNIAGLNNPLLYAPSLKSVAKRRDFLEKLLHQFLNPVQRGKKTNPSTDYKSSVI